MSYDFIYQAAQEENAEARIQAHLDAGNDINEIKERGTRGPNTPAAKLAEEGKFDAVEILRNLGANTIYIARGYARGGYFDILSEYRANYKTELGYILEGLAQGGHSQKVEEYRRQEEIPEFGDAYNNAIAKGYAMAGNIDKVAEYFSQHHAKYDEIVIGFRAGGHEALIAELDARELTREDVEPSIEPITNTNSTLDNLKIDAAIVWYTKKPILYSALLLAVVVSTGCIYMSYVPPGFEGFSQGQLFGSLLTLCTVGFIALGLIGEKFFSADNKAEDTNPLREGEGPNLGNGIERPEMDPTVEVRPDATANPQPAQQNTV